MVGPPHTVGLGRGRGRGACVGDIVEVEVGVLNTVINIISRAGLSHPRFSSDLSAASLSHSCEITQSNPSPQSGMVQPVVNEMFATVHAAGSSLLGLFTSCTTFDSTWTRPTQALILRLHNCRYSGDKGIRERVWQWQWQALFFFLRLTTRNGCMRGEGVRAVSVAAG
eukprot:scaffold19930_cov115-Isochrysis_galbana.AAC.6